MRIFSFFRRMRARKSTLNITPKHSFEKSLAELTGGICSDRCLNDKTVILEQTFQTLTSS